MDLELLKSFVKDNLAEITEIFNSLMACLKALMERFNGGADAE